MKMKLLHPQPLQSDAVEKSVAEDLWAFGAERLYRKMTKKVSIIALLAAINCFVLTESFLAVADGQVFLNKRMKLVYFTKGQLFGMSG
jgi:hypothetical protein